MSSAFENASGRIEQWPEESREAALLVINEFGEPDEITPTQLTWHNAGPWKRIVATKVFYTHNFPVPHIDSVESVLDFKVPADKFTALAKFDGSVIVERTAGEVSARCHDIQANLLALNLMHDIVTDRKSVQEAREYYAKEFADYRRKVPTPYMEKLHFDPMESTAAQDPDERILSKEQLERAAAEGKQQSRDQQDGGARA